MKIITAILLLGASVSHAVAVTEPAPGARKVSPWCGVVGSDCFRLKRSADAIASAFATASDSKPGYTFCDVQGQPCANAADHIQRVGEVNHRAYNDGIVAREARKISEWCGAGGDCFRRKREAEAEARKISHWCGAGGDCFKAKRGALPEPGHNRWCGVRGSDCFKIKREAEPTALKHVSLWCGAGGDCFKRDVDNAIQAARTVSEWDPQLVTAPCYTEGGECAALLQAHSDFHRIKREAEALQQLDRDAKKAYCAGHPCDEAADYVLRQPLQEAKRAEEECYGPEGDCTIAARGLAEIENQLNEAVASLAK